MSQRLPGVRVAFVGYHVVSMTHAEVHGMGEKELEKPRHRK
jgi:hypothetical protein